MVKRMSFLLVLAAVLTAMLGTVKCQDGDGTEKCGMNMVYSSCGGSCQKTCQDVSNMGLPRDCKIDCRPGCECVPGYVLQNGTCIPEKDCTCLENAEYTECDGLCQFSCEDVANMVFRKEKACPLICLGGCVCKGDYALKSGKCVPEKECPCKKNSQYNNCGTCRRTCEDVANNVTVKACTKDCKNGCFCNRGYALNSTECVLEKDCPCNKNAHYETCGSACPLTCDNYSNPPRTCVRPCVSGCVCDKGYVKSGNACVLPGQCSGATSS